MTTRLEQAHAIANPELTPTSENEPVSVPLVTLRALVSIAESCQSNADPSVRSWLLDLDVAVD